MNVVSFCDGISTGRLALEMNGIKVDNYFAYEIDKHAIKIAQKNFPNTIQLGDLRKADFSKLPKIDLVLAGVECKNWSIAGKQNGLVEGTSGDLIIYAVEGLIKLKPKFFLFEMTPMKSFNQRVFNALMRCEPHLIDASLVSMGRRLRNYYTNIYFEEIKDRGLNIQSLAKEGEDVVNFSSSGRGVKGVESRRTLSDKALTLTAGGYGNRAKTFIQGDGYTRDLTINELEVIQCLPIDYTAGVSDRQRVKCIGNGWNAEVVAHILRKLKWGKTN